MTLSPPADCTEELNQMHERFARLAREKSLLQLNISLINKITSAPGLDAITDNILLGLLNVIGGTTIALYYLLDNTLQYADIGGTKKSLPRCDDKLVQDVFATGIPRERALDFSDTLMMTPEFGKAFTWVYPLAIGSEVIGVLKIENLHVPMQDISPHLLTLFRYIAMALNNEITGESRLKKANEELSREVARRQKAQKKLSLSYEMLEHRVADRTEALKVANDALSAERALLMNIINATDAMIVYLDPEFNFVLLNNAYAETCNMKPEDMIGKNHFALFPSENEAIFRQVRDTGISVFLKDNPFEFPDQPERGVTYWDWSLSPVKDPQGVLLGLVFVLRETTKYRVGELARQKVEDNIRILNEELEHRVKERTAELERINRDLEEFCYAISHEFRAPVARFEGFGTMLLETAAEGDKEATIHCAQRIVAASKRLRTVIDALLALNRISRVEMHMQQVNLTDMVQHLVAEFEESLGDRRVNIAIQPDVSAFGDRYQLEVSLRNLIGNALKYTAHNPDTFIEFGQKTVDGELIYFVRDNGVGFDMAFTKNIFVPFCRLHSEPEFEGTGIGLSTVHRIIEKHHGRIWAESEEGKGATFYFTLGTQAKG